MKIGGDKAENKFRDYAEKNNLTCTKYGPDRGVKRFYMVDPFVASTPDFIVIGKHASLVEAKGTGKANHVKVKQDNLEQLGKWNKIMPVSFFFYDSSLDKYAIMCYNDVVEVSKSSPTGTYPDNNRLYYMLPKTAFNWQGF